MAACSASSGDGAGTGGSAVIGGAGTLGGGGNRGSGGIGGGAPTTGGASGTAGAPSAGAGGGAGAAGATATDGGAGTTATGAAGSTATAGAAGSTAGAGAGGTAGVAGAGGAGGAGTGCLGNDIDLRATTVSGKITVNGAALTDPTTQGQGTIFLRNATDSAQLGTTSAAGGSYTALVFPGTYDLYYRNSFPGTAVPRNNLAKLQGGIVVGTSPLKLDVDVPATTVAGNVTVNGDGVSDREDPTSAPGYAAVSLVNAAGDSVVLGGVVSSSSSGVPCFCYSAVVVPGSYDLIYTLSTYGPFLPTNASGKIRSGIVVGTSSPQILSVDIPASTVSVSITINGAAVTGSAMDGGWALWLKNAAGDSAGLPTYSSTTGAYSGLVIPGTYDLYWNGYGAQLPANAGAKIQSGIVVGTSAVSLTADVPSTTISGTVTLAGSVSSSLSGNLKLRSPVGGTVTLYTSATGTFSAQVIPGTYDFVYAPSASAPTVLPKNSVATIRSGIVVGASPVSLNIDIPATTVSGTATINGAAITTSAQAAFVLYLQDQSDAGDRAQIAIYPKNGTYSVFALAGTYDLYYSRQGNIGLVIPNNVSTRIQSGIVVGASPVARDVDIRGTTVSGGITVNGLATAAAAGDMASLTLLDGTQGSALLTSATSATGTYTTFVLPGRYELFYAFSRSSGTSLPTNTNTDLGCFIVP